MIKGFTASKSAAEGMSCTMFLGIFNLGDYGLVVFAKCGKLCYMLLVVAAFETSLNIKPYFFIKKDI